MLLPKIVHALAVVAMLMLAAYTSAIPFGTYTVAPAGTVLLPLLGPMLPGCTVP